MQEEVPPQNLGNQSSEQQATPNSNLSAKRLPVLLLAIIVIAIASGGYFLTRKTSLNIKSTKLTTLSNEAIKCLIDNPQSYPPEEPYKNCLIDQGIYFSSDGKQVAYTIFENGKWFLMVNDQKSRAYDAIYPQPIIDPSGKHLAFIAENNGQQFVLLDGQQGKAYQDIVTAESNDLGGGQVPFVESLNSESGVTYYYSAAFSANGNHLAYAARQGDKWRIIYDGNEGSLYDSVSKPLFSPDSQHFVYVATNNSQVFAVLDGHEEKYYQAIKTAYAVSPSNDTGVIFSPDSNKLAYIASDGNKYFVVVSGREGKHYSEIEYLTFSPDSKILAYAAATNATNHPEFIVLNEKQGKSYFNIFGGTVSFSPDGKRILFITQESNSNSNQNERVVTVDQVNSIIHEQVYRRVLSSIFWKGDEPVYKVRSNSHEFVVVGDQKNNSFDKIGGMVISANGNHIIYTGQRKSQWFVVIDGEELGPYDEVGYPQISDVGKHWGFSFRKDKKWTAMIDGKESGTYNFIPSYSILFSQNSDKNAFEVQETGKSFMVVSGNQEKKYDVILNNVSQHPLFNTAGSLTYVSKVDKKWLVVSNNVESQAYDYVFTQPISVSSDKIGYGVLDGNELWWVVTDIMK